MMTTEKSALELLDDEIEKESLVLMKKNAFFLQLMNEIGKALDENYKEIKEFNLEANLQDFIDLCNYFLPLCGKKLEKSVAIRLISMIILKAPNQEENFEKLMKLINDLKEIVIQENYLRDGTRRMNVMITLMEDIKPFLSEEKNNYLENYKKLFGMDIATLFEIFTYFFGDNDKENLLHFSLKALMKKYNKLIISDDIFNSKEIKEAININCLSQLFLLKFSKEQKIIVFEKSCFLIREPNNQELEAYFKEDFSKKIKKYSEGSLNKKKVPVKENNSPKIQKLDEITSKNLNFDPKSFSPVERFLYDKLEVLDKKLKDMEQENLQLKFKLNVLDLDLKKNKLRSLYKGIIDVFASTYEIELNDYYYNKLKKIIIVLDKSPKNQKVDELKSFLLDIYSYLRKGNYLAHTVEENVSPLEMIFSMIEKDKKKYYPNVKELLKTLSFNETLKYVENNYYSLKDKENLVKNIKFSPEKLANLLMKQQ